jgi:RNA recognition motif-containing protein
MGSTAEAAAAVAALNGLEANGRSMNVDFALSKEESKNRPAREPRTDREPRSPRAPRADTTGRRVYVGNLGYSTTDGNTQAHTFCALRSSLSLLLCCLLLKED